MHAKYKDIDKPDDTRFEQTLVKFRFKSIDILVKNGNSKLIKCQRVYEYHALSTVFANRLHDPMETCHFRIPDKQKFLS
jgi:hypothetical protein